MNRRFSIRPGRFLVVALLLVVFAAPSGCSLFTGGSAAPEPASEDTPERAFERLKDALRSRDWNAVYETAASPSTQELFDADFEKVKRELVGKGGDTMFAESVIGVSRDEYLDMNAKDFFVKTSEASGDRSDLLIKIPGAESVRDARIVDTKIEGDEAMLTVKLDDGQRPMELFREDGRWYFQLLDLD